MTEIAVTGIHNRTCNIYISHGKFTSNILTAYFVLTLAVIDNFFHIFDIFKSCRCCNKLECRAGGIQSRTNTVNIYTVIFLVIFHVFGYIFGVVCRSAYHAYHFASFIIIEKYCTFSVAQSLISRFLKFRIYCKGYIISLSQIFWHSKGKKKMIADKLGTVYILYGVIKIDSTVITDNVQTSFSYTFIIIVKSLTAAAVCKHFTVSVIYRSCIVKIACRCQMKITKIYHPILCIDKYIYCVIKKSRKKCYRQNKNDI